MPIAIGHRTMRIARQSIWAGLGLSGAAMVVAAFGHIPPTIGAMLQEGIDVAVIFNALRAAAPLAAARGQVPRYDRPTRSLSAKKRVFSVRAFSDSPTLCLVRARTLQGESL